MVLAPKTITLSSICTDISSLPLYNVNKLSEFVDNYYQDMMTMKKIPSPIDDLIDSFWALQILMNDKIHKKFWVLNP